MHDATAITVATAANANDRPRMDPDYRACLYFPSTGLVLGASLTRKSLPSFT